MAFVEIKVDVKGALKGIEGDIDALMQKADRKFRVAGTRMEAYAKAAAPVDTGFHRRNIRHNPRAPFLTAEVTAAAEYASVLELGFSGPVYVDGYTRRDGTQVGSYLFWMERKPRPHIEPGARRALTQLIDDLKKL